LNLQQNLVSLTSNVDQAETTKTPRQILSTKTPIQPKKPKRKTT